jgi:hypothetical protein
MISLLSLHRCGNFEKCSVFLGLQTLEAEAASKFPQQLRMVPGYSGPGMPIQ